MSARHHASTGLSSRIRRTTLLIGVVIIVVSAVVALLSVARLSERQSTGRDLVASRLIEDKLLARFEVARSAMSRIGEHTARTFPDTDVPTLVMPVAGNETAPFRRVIVVDSRGRVLGSSDDTVAAEAARMPDGSPVFKAARGGARGLLTTTAGAADRWQLWYVWAPSRPTVPDFYVLGELDTRFVTSALEHAAGDERSVLLLDGDTVLASAGTGVQPDMRAARWVASSQNSGRVTFGGPARGMVGSYVQLAEAEELGWRLVVLVPSGIGVREAWQAVLPPGMVLLVGGLVMLVAGTAFTTRLVRPLHELERAARVAASGSYVKPIVARDDDEIGRVADAFNQVSLRLNALHDLAQLLASARDVDQVLDGITSAIGHLVGPGVEAVYLYDEGIDALVPAKSAGLRSGRLLPIQADTGAWLARVLFSAEPDCLSEPDRIAEELPGLAGRHHQALAVPLVAGREPLGVVVALPRADRALNEADIEMVKTFSAQAAVAVQTSRLFEHESRSRRVAEALRTVAEELVRPDGLEPALRRIERVIVDLFDASAAHIVVVDRAAVALGGASSDRDDALLAVALRALGAPPATTPAVVTRGHDPRDDEVLDRLGGERLLVVPVALDGDHGAVMVIAGGPALASPDRFPVAVALADEIALALDNAYFYERALTRASNLETIFRISQAVGSSLQIKVVLNRVLDVVQKILSADAVALLEYDSRRRSLVTAMARGSIPPSLLHLELPPGEDLPGHVFSSGRPATLRDLHAGMRGVAGDAAAHDLRSLLAVPLLARGRSIGVLMVFSTDAAAFRSEDSSMLQTFATQAALAIDTARLYSREHEVASVLQSSILPDELPDFPEVEAASVYAPASSDAEIGGDYYDLFRAPSGDIWFAIADVCGKGVHAATRTSMIKYALRAFAAAGLCPAQVLSGLNRMVSESGTPSDIVTVWVGRVDRDASRLTWANGGHPPGVLRRADGSPVPLEVTGPLLGAIPEVPYDEMAVAVAPGDRVLLYTDGVTEARSGNIFFGEQRVLDVFTGEGTTDEAARGLLDAVRRFARSDLRDDVAVLVVSFRASGRIEAADGPY